MTARRATPRTGGDGDRYNVRAIGRAIMVLNVFTRERNRLSLDDITRDTGLSKPTAFRILATLESNGYVKLDPVDGRYRLGSVFLALGAAALASMSMRSSAHPHLVRLKDTLRTTVLLGALMDDLLVYVDKIESPGPVRISADIGWRRDPPNFGMLGMILLAHLDETESARLLAKTPLRAYTPKSLTGNAEFAARLVKIREQGYVVEQEEAIEGVFGVAAPVFDSSGGAVAAVGAAFPMSSPERTRVSNVIRQVQKTASAISFDLGHRAGP